MLDFIPYITNANVMAFLLLFLRFSSILAFFPFFDNQIIPVSVRAALAFILAVVFMPTLQSIISYPTLASFILAGLFEITLGFVCGLVLQIAFSSIIFAGDLASFSMGFTMASAYDPTSGTTKPIVAQVVSMLSILMALYFNFHYLLIDIIAYTINDTPLGGFLMTTSIPDIAKYFVKAFGNMILIGFSMAFPIIAVILLSDIIFGMIMKTHPQFNLLVIGFPVKIALAFVILTIIVPSIIYHFKEDLSQAIKILAKILGQ
ncbi:flagellar type III secretion system protein FliR [Helicobacter muridarum]|uniref:Flagellar biosynthetic protein FliR n=1 Tax=Helicobacter muridarum TaxID=216 RepID=A0A099U035_9HELI|nr:flagellar biosynthetic protein FliR [Helicobacter muridarum]TLE00635.1 flagellar type III secretion system protein FliR [Helicobacter muridarum]STQ85653.1 flagellar biosynthesis protein [Helicobacter muridarum]